MVYYLKINTLNAYTFNNIINWINIVASEEGARLYLLCDDEQLIKELFETVPVIQELVEVIKSERDEPVFREIAEHTLAPKWYPAGFAHLTTFLHADRNGIDSYWNIDADDTLLSVEPDNAKLILKRVEHYAKENNIYAFSLDMHSSRTNGVHWSFGITYTDNSINWFDVMRRYYKEYQTMRKEFSGTENLDWYFTFLRSHADVRLETFYVENLIFAHYRGDFMYRVPPDGIYYWMKGRYVSLIQKYILGMEEQGDTEIPADLVKIDAGIKYEQSLNYFRSFFGKDILLNADPEKTLCNKMVPFLK